MIPITWPFVVWGLDLVGPLKRAPGGYTHLLVTVDKFTKWIEARPISMIKSEDARASLEDAMDQLDEAHNVAVLRSAKYQQALRRYHDRRVRGQAFNIGDLVLRRVQSSKDHHKLSPPWEGPYVITEVLRPGTYKLKTIDGEVFTNVWNIEQLHRFYP